MVMGRLYSREGDVEPFLLATLPVTVLVDRPSVATLDAAA